MTPMALELVDVEARLGGRPVLAGVNARLRSGELVAIVGPNGAGKSTLLKALAGLLPCGGAIVLDGRPLRAIARNERARLVSYLPQERQVHWPLRAIDIVALGRFAHGLSDPSRPDASHAAAIARALAQTDAAHLAERSCAELSGGELARVLLARLFAGEAPVLLADEPVAALDPHHQLAAIEALRAQAKNGALVVAVMHDLSIACRFADRLLLLDKGRVMTDGPPAAVIAEGALERAFGVETAKVEHAGEQTILPWVRRPVS